MAQAKITVSHAQAQALGLLVHKKKPVYPILYEPKSGVNLRETKGNEVIEVPDGANLYNLKRFYEAGYFTVVEGKIADVTTFVSISVSPTGFIDLNFDQPVYTAGLGEGDFVVKVDGEPIEGLTVGALVKAQSRKKLSIDSGETPKKGQVFSVEITAQGAAKIKDAGDVAIKPTTKSLTY